MLEIEKNLITINLFQVVREFVDGADLEALMKNPSLSPAVKCPEKRITLAVGKYLPKQFSEIC